MITIWQANLTDKEAAQLTDLQYNQIVNDLLIHFQQLKDKHLDKGGAK